MKICKVLLTVMSLVECVCFAGLHYGWNSLVYILKDNHVFRDLCYRSNSSLASADLSCKLQDERLNLIFSVALASVFVCIVYIGFLNAKLGETKTRLIQMIVFAAGTLCLAFTSEDSPWLSLPGLILIGAGGYSLVVTNIRIALLYTRGSAIYSCVMNGAFDSSAVIMVVIKILYENGVDYKYSFFAVLILYTVISGSCTFLHWFVIDKNITEQIHLDFEIDVSQEDVKNYGNNKDNSYTKDSDRSGVDIPCRRLIFSMDFMMQAVWMCSNVLNFAYFIGSMNSKLEHVLQNTSEVSHYTNVLGYVMTGGIGASIISGLFQEWQKWLYKDNPSVKRQKLFPLVLPLFITSLLGVALGVLSLVTTSKATLYASFVLVLIYRDLIFGVNINYMITIFPPRQAALIFGIVLSIVGSISLLQYPLILWRDSYDDAQKHVSVVLVLLGAVSMLQSIRTWVTAIRCDSKDG